MPSLLLLLLQLALQLLCKEAALLPGVDATVSDSGSRRLLAIFESQALRKKRRAKQPGLNSARRTILPEWVRLAWLAALRFLCLSDLPPQSFTSEH